MNFVWPCPSSEPHRSTQRTATLLQHCAGRSQAGATWMSVLVALFLLSMLTLAGAHALLAAQKLSREAISLRHAEHWLDSLAHQYRLAGVGSGPAMAWQTEGQAIFPNLSVTHSAQADGTAWLRMCFSSPALFQNQLQAEPQKTIGAACSTQNRLTIDTENSGSLTCLCRSIQVRPDG